MTANQSPNQDQADLRLYIGIALFGPKYYDYILSPVTDPPSKYPYPGAIAKLDEIMQFIESAATRREQEALKSIGEPTLQDVGLMQPDQYEGGVIINKWYQDRIAHLTPKEKMK